MDIKNIVYLTNEQYEELLKNGSVNVNGEIKMKEEGTVYVCPATESWAELNNKIDEALIKPNKVMHNPYTIEELENIIAKLREDYNETDSVVGFRCIMKKGQQLKASSNYNMYLNGTLREHDYTCTNDNEMISIALFATGENLNITSELIQFKNNIETYIEQLVSPIIIEKSLYITANLLTMLNFELNTVVYSEEFRGNKVITTENSKATSCLPNIKRLKFTGNKVGNAFLFNNTILEEASLDDVTVISTNYQCQPFSEVSNDKLVLNFPNLLEISLGTAYGNASSCLFANIKHLIIGEKLKALKGMLLTGTCGTVELYCKNATNSLLNNNLGMTASVDYLYLCPEWNCGFSIANISGITKENIIEIFNNLKDLTNEDTKTLTIKSDLYESLTEENLLIATQKNWTIAYK